MSENTSDKKSKWFIKLLIKLIPYALLLVILLILYKQAKRYLNFKNEQFKNEQFKSLNEKIPNVVINESNGPKEQLIYQHRMPDTPIPYKYEDKKVKQPELPIIPQHGGDIKPVGEESFENTIEEKKQVENFDSYSDLRGVKSIYGENKNPEWLSEELVQVELKDNPTIINNIPVNTNDLVDFSYDENENDLHKLADSMTGSVVTDINDNNLKLIQGKVHNDNIPNPIPNYKPLFERYADNYSHGLVNYGTKAYVSSGFGSSL